MNLQVVEELLVKYTVLSEKESDEIIDSIILANDHHFQADLEKGIERDKKVLSALKMAIEKRIEPDRLLRVLDGLGELYTQLNEDSQEYWFLFGLRIGTKLHNYKNSK